MKIILITFSVLLGLLVIMVGLFLWKGIFIFPAFLLPKESQQVFEGKNCDNFSELFKRNWCYKSAALKTRDPSLCEKMIVSSEDNTSSQNKEYCYMDIARNTKNPSLCEKLNQFKTQCMSESQK